jgi:hypothetical protein
MPCGGSIRLVNFVCPPDLRPGGQNKIDPPCGGSISPQPAQNLPTFCRPGQFCRSIFFNINVLAYAESIILSALLAESMILSACAESIILSVGGAESMMLSA